MPVVNSSARPRKAASKTSMPPKVARREKKARRSSVQNGKAHERHGEDL